jgi:hypothetical protein
VLKKDLTGSALLEMDGNRVNQGLAKRANGAVAELGNDPHRRIDSVTRRIGS